MKSDFVVVVLVCLVMISVAGKRNRKAWLANVCYFYFSWSNQLTAVSACFGDEKYTFLCIKEMYLGITDIMHIL